MGVKPVTLLLLTTITLGITLLLYHPFTFLHGDSLIYAFITHSIVSDHDIEIADDVPFRLPETQEKSFYALGQDGKTLYPKHNLLLPLLAAPLYALFGVNGFLLTNLLLFFGIITFASLPFKRPWPLFLALWFAGTFLQPLFLHYLYNYSPDLLSSLLMVLMALCLIQGRGGGMGIVSGLLLFLRPIYALQALLGFLFTPRRGRFLAGFFPLLALYGGMNWILFGAPWISAYQRVAVHASGGGIAVMSHLSLLSFDPARIVQILFSPSRGLLFTAPFTLLQFILLVVIFLKKRGRFHLFLLLTGFWQVIFLLFYPAWDTSSFGIRFLIPVAALMVFTSPFSELTGKEVR